MAPAEANSFRFSLLHASPIFSWKKQGGISRLPSIHQRKCGFWVVPGFLACNLRWLDYMVSTLSTESLDFIKATNGERGPMDYPYMDSLSMDYYGLNLKRKGPKGPVADAIFIVYEK